MSIEETARAVVRRIISESVQAGAGEGALEAIRIRTYADEESYDLLGPQQKHETWALHQAINRHLAAGFARRGIAVEFLVLCIDGYRRWLRDRNDSPEMRGRYSEIMEHGLSAPGERRTLH